MDRNYQMLNACDTPSMKPGLMEYAVYYLVPQPSSMFLLRLSNFVIMQQFLSDNPPRLDKWRKHVYANII